MLKKEGVQRESHPSRPEVTRRMRYTRLGLSVESRFTHFALYIYDPPDYHFLSMAPGEPKASEWLSSPFTGIRMAWFQLS